jgi:outer membrane biosynthesis protein TonB
MPQVAQTPPSPSQPASPDLPPSPKLPSDTPAFTPETAARKVEGTISNRSDKAALDVEATDLGRYKKEVTQAIERQWHRYREQNASFVTYGSLRVSFRIDPGGAARNLKIVRNDANAVMANFTLRSILDAKIPKMPPEVATQVGQGLEFSYNVIIY